MSFSLSPHAKACAQVGAPLFGAAIGLALTAIVCGVGHQTSNPAPDGAAQYAQVAQSGYDAASARSETLERLKDSSGKRGRARGHELDCLTQAVYYEARGESAAGQAAVAQVVMNRVRDPNYPSSVCGVVFQARLEGGCQFSFACDGAMNRPLEPVAWRQARLVATRALGGYVMTEVGQALNFHVARASVTPREASGPVAHLGRHVFFVALTRPIKARHAAPVRTREAKLSEPSPPSAQTIQNLTMALSDVGALRAAGGSD